MELFLNSFDLEDEAEKSVHELWIDRMTNGDDNIQLASLSPIRKVSELQSRVLLVHAQDDEVVDVEHSRRFSDRAQRAGKSVRYIELAEGGHQLVDPKGETDVLVAVEVFIRFCMPVATQPD